MKISAQMAFIGAIFFTIFCFGFAINGFTSLGDIADAGQLDDAKGYAWFWAFLGTIGLVFGALSLWIARTRKD